MKILSYTFLFLVKTVALLIYAGQQCIPLIPGLL
jgi:hypothetical protein